MESGNLNWNIKNFSCWHQAVHELYIETPELPFNDCCIKLKVYPEGTSEFEECMTVNFSIITTNDDIFGDLLFISSDGSTLCTLRVEYYYGTDISDFDLPPGPKLKRVIDKIREDELDHEDQLILRLQVENDHVSRNNISSVIDVFKVNLELDRNIIGNSEISTIKFLQNDEDKERFVKIKMIGCQIALFLENFEVGDGHFSVLTHLSVLNDDGSLVRYEHNFHVFHSNYWWIFSGSQSKKELLENFKSLILRLKIIPGNISYTLQKVELHSDSVKIVSDQFKSDLEKILNEKDGDLAFNEQENSMEELSRELMCLYLDQDFSDMQIKCGNDIFPAHKNILSARSPVFKKMLLSDMKETASGVVNIEDLDAQTLSQFLHFLYKGELGEKLTRDMALKLYYAADKYQVPSLIIERARFLTANVSNSNVCDVLLLGDKHQDIKLLSAAHRYILMNYNEFLKSKEWNSFMSIQPLLAAKTVTLFAERYYVGNLKTV